MGQWFYIAKTALKKDRREQSVLYPHLAEMASVNQPLSPVASIDEFSEEEL